MTQQWLIRVGCAFTMYAAHASAQNPVPADVHTEIDVIHRGPPTAGVKLEKGMPGPHMETFAFVSADMSMDARTVKGAPYSAEAVTEMTQVLADGNRIVRKTKASVYRDGEGRTRREQTFGAIGPWASAGKAPHTVFINDPVSKTHHILNDVDKTARKMPVPPMFVDGESGGPPKQMAGGSPGRAKLEAEDVLEGSFTVGGVQSHTSVRFESALPAPKVEKLGKRTIEGVVTEGTRSTMTIAAGEVGNERAIEITSERWYSPELQTVMMTTHNDPRMGETVYKLTQVRLGEPSPSLFELPAEYKVTEGLPRIRNFRMQRPVEK